MIEFEKIPKYFKTIWTDFTLKNNDLYEVEIDLINLSASETLKMVALNFAKYSATDGTGYGEGKAERGITEQEAYDIWAKVFQSEQRKFKSQLTKINVTALSQSVYDGLLLYYWATTKFLTVDAHEGVYNLHNHLHNRDWDTVAGMIMRSKVNKKLCVKAATILRLADYGKPKSRSLLRTKGIYKMRTGNELGALTEDQKNRARFAYYAETLKFLPFTPETKKRNIAKEYEKTLINRTFVYDGENTVFTLDKSPAMHPVEKLTVKVNGNLMQNVYDFTVEENKLTMLIEMKADDIISTVIKI